MPYPSPIVSGMMVVQRLILSELWVFGSPTAVMYRSSIVRATRPFYDESCLHEDTEACVRLLRDWDLGFVHQVLSFLRTGNESITARVKDLVPDMLDAYIISRRYAPMFFSAMESRSIRRDVKVRYYRFLARSVLRAREPDFWRYHSRGLATISEPVDWPFLALSLAKELVWLAINPGLAAATALRLKKRGERSAIRLGPTLAPALDAEGGVLSVTDVGEQDNRASSDRDADVRIRHLISAGLLGLRRRGEALWTRAWGSRRGRPRRVLYVNHDFPPMSGPAVWRALWFTRYLAISGYGVTVLCADRSDWCDRYDQSLLHHIPAEVQIKRVKARFLTTGPRPIRLLGIGTSRDTMLAKTLSGSSKP